MPFHIEDDEDEDELETYLDEVTTDEERRSLLPTPGQALPQVMLEQAMSARELAQFKQGEGITAVIEAPGADWVLPLLEAGKKVARWPLALSAVVPERKAKDSIIRDQVVRTSGAGHRVLGVSQSPTSHLPAGMAASADMTVKVRLPDDLTIKRTIRAVTGRYPREMPADIAKGLDFAEICFAIRKGSKPSECVERLLAAGRARVKGDDQLAQVPELDHLHGYGEAMEWAQDLVADLDAWRRGELDFSAIQRTVILASEPGLGKTTFVRSLAKSARLPLVATSVSSWFLNSNGHLDGVIKQIDQLFSSAAAQSPCIVLLDECEGIPSRATLGSRNADWWTPVIGHMLLTLDSATSGVTSRLIVIGATNHPEKLDAALVRQGRLSRIIEIGRPDEKALAGILRQHLGQDLPGADLATIGTLGIGASGADVTGWVKGARSRARQEGRALAFEDLLHQVAPPRPHSLEIEYRIAVHEAGHAVYMQVAGMLEIGGLSTIGRDGSGGRTMVAMPTDLLLKPEMETMVSFVLAGRCAEEAILGSVSNGSGGSEESDLARATHMVSMAHASLGMGGQLLYRGGPEEVRRMLAMDFRLAQAIEAELQRLYAGAMAVILEYREAVEAVAAALVRERHIDGDRFREIFERHPPGSKTIEAGGSNG